MLPRTAFRKPLHIVAGLLEPGHNPHELRASRGIDQASGRERMAAELDTGRRLAAILAADVAGYSRLMGADDSRPGGEQVRK